MRGPLTLLKEIWEGDKHDKEPVNVVSYVLQMKEKLDKSYGGLSYGGLSATSENVVQFYQAARDRDFQFPCQKVLVMLPTDDSKLLA